MCITGEVLLLNILVVYLSVTRYATGMDASWLFQLATTLVYTFGR